MHINYERNTTTKRVDFLMLTPSNFNDERILNLLLSAILESRVIGVKDDNGEYSVFNFGDLDLTEQE